MLMDQISKSAIRAFTRPIRTIPVNSLGKSQKLTSYREIQLSTLFDRRA
jgi:hypothetical protein